MLIKPVATTDELRFRKDMHNAPMGQKVLVINEGGVAVFAKLNKTNLHHFTEWCPLPKRALENEDA